MEIQDEHLDDCVCTAGYARWLQNGTTNGDQSELISSIEASEGVKVVIYLSAT